MAASKTALVNVALSKLGTTLINHIDQLNSKEAETARAHYDTVLAETLREHPWTFARRSASLTALAPAEALPFTAVVPGYSRKEFTFDTSEYVNGTLKFSEESVTNADGETVIVWAVSEGDTVLFIADADYDHPAVVMHWQSYPDYGAADVVFEYSEFELYRFAYVTPSWAVATRHLFNKDGKRISDFCRVNAFDSQVILCDEPDLRGTFTSLVTDTTAFDPLFERAMTCLLASRMARRITGSDAMENSMLQAYDVALADARFRDAQTDDSNENRTSLEQMLQADFLTNRDEY